MVWLPVAAQLLGGGLQSIFGGAKKRREIKNLENLTNQSPSYTGGGSIRDYYNKALQRYDVNPYTSTEYQMAQQNAQRTTNQGLSALQDRKSIFGNLGKLMALQNDANLKAGIVAEQEGSRKFSQLGSAAQANAAEDKYRYQMNQLNPYLRRLSLQQQKAAGAAATEQAGLQNVFGGLSSLSTLLNKDENGDSGSQTTAKSSYTFPRLSSSMDKNTEGVVGLKGYNEPNEDYEYDMNGRLRKKYLIENQ